ncbi:NeuD/PglB/VioB family sugar acetyltransferase [Ferrovibrio terrae]|uniref:NeuD/PglB/VioB family sugar acetyltransferase n=1 Tax=Ferrovibrio terrae TaxID=2594003 RepID=UPI0031377955
MVIDALQCTGATVLGVCDPSLSPGSAGPLGISCLGSDDALDHHDKARILLANGIGSTGDPSRRIAVYQRLTAAGWRFVSLVHPAAIVGSGCTIESGAQIMAGAILQPGTRVGQNAIINTAASVDHDCDIGDHAHIAPGAVLCGGVSIGAATHIGSGSVVVQGVVIGANAKIGAGTIVTTSMPVGAHVGAGLVVRKETAV